MSLPKKNSVEWAVFSVSLALVAAVVVSLAAQVASAADAPAQIVAEAGPLERAGGELMVPVRVSNAGDAAAEEIVVEVALERPGADPETVELTFERLAQRELAAGVAVFADRGGEPGRARARVLSYRTP